MIKHDLVLCSGVSSNPCEDKDILCCASRKNQGSRSNVRAGPEAHTCACARCGCHILLALNFLSISSYSKPTFNSDNMVDVWTCSLPKISNEGCIGLESSYTNSSNSFCMTAVVFLKYVAKDPVEGRRCRSKYTIHENMLRTTTVSRRYIC
jgi:hypothetical protein